ncbi:F-box/RNI/FBD-like domain protein, partial [Trifolium pratense]
MDDIWSGKWKWVLEVLQHSPKLQHLTIHQEIENIGISEAYWEDPQIVPQCLSSQLKTFLFRGCRGKN